MKYFYNIGYSSYEDSARIAIAHEQEFSKQQLQEMIFNVLPEIVNTRLAELEKEHRDYLTVCQEVICEPSPFVLRDIEEQAVKFCDIYKDVVRLLCERFGFVPVKFAVNFVPFGWANLLSNIDWSDERCELVTAMTAFLKEKGYSIKEKQYEEDD